MGWNPNQISVDDYLDDREEVIISSQAEWEEGNSGELACTNQRLVHAASGPEIVDIDLSSIDSVEYTREPINWVEVLGGLALTLFGIVGSLYAVGQLGGGNELILPILFLLLGLVALAIALYRSRILIVRTPNKAYRFESQEELGKMGKVIRDNS